MLLEPLLSSIFILSTFFLWVINAGWNQRIDRVSGTLPRLCIAAFLNNNTNNLPNVL